MEQKFEKIPETNGGAGPWLYRRSYETAGNTLTKKATCSVPHDWGK